MIPAALLASLTGCAELQPDTIGQVLADHTLTDVNATSATFDTDVTVSSFQGQVSAWYFGHAT